jgi:SAM-dependent methyltransferase
VSDTHPRPFARYYDLVYSDKDYQKDIDDFQVLRASQASNLKTLIEIGAGTGGQSFRLSELVGQLYCVEIDPDFASIFEAKLANDKRENMHLLTHALPLDSKLAADCAVAFFHVLNYIVPDHMEDFLQRLSSHLKVGAPFITDLWNREAVMLDPPVMEERNKTVNGREVVQKINPSLNKRTNTVELNYEITIDNNISFEETLTLYLWSRDELEFLFNKFEMIDAQWWDYRLFPRQASKESWKVWLKVNKK